MLFGLFGFSIAASPALAQDLSRTWEGSFSIAEHTDVNLKVFHLPNGTIRAAGRFSNGMQTVDRTITALVFIKNENGDVWRIQINERVPMTGLGGSEVRWKEDEIPIEGSVAEIRGGAFVVDTGVSFGIEIECTDGESNGVSCKLNNAEFANESDVVLGYTRSLVAGPSVDICANFISSTEINVAAQTATFTRCDSRSGEITKHTKVLVHHIPVCPTCEPF